MFQGRAGGDYVVGGHVYCNNIGTIGIALMGNFNETDPRKRKSMRFRICFHDLQKNMSSISQQRVGITERIVQILSVIEIWERQHVRRKFV